MFNPVIKTKVIKTGEAVEVYKLKDGSYSIFLGDKMKLSAIEQKDHQRVFNESELDLPKKK